MKTLRTVLCFALVASCALVSSQGSNPGAQIKGNNLFGDMKVDERLLAKDQSIAFQVVLYTEFGAAVSRQQVSPNGRFRFLNVPNGVYELAVERSGNELARSRIILNETRFTDIRHDLNLEWNPSAEGLYQRTPLNAGRFKDALVAGEKKDYVRSAKLLREIVASDAKDFESWTELGTAHFKQEKYKEAEEFYRKALEQKPGFQLALMNSGKVQLVQKNYAAAIDSLSQALQQQPQSADANYYLGEAFLGAKKGSKAVGYLNEAIRLDPIGKADAHLRLAALYNAAAMKDKAAVEYEQFLAKIPNHPEKAKLQQYIRQNKKL